MGLEWMMKMKVVVVAAVVDFVALWKLDLLLKLLQIWDKGFILFVMIKGNYYNN